MENIKTNREKFSSGLAVFFATLGSAVGLGNIWRFPYLTGENGGGAFLLVYLLSVLLVGIPIMVGEFYIGRKTRKNAVGAFEELKPKQLWSIIGYMGVASSYLIMFFYSCVAGWVYSYIFKVIRGDFAVVTKETAESQFMNAILGPVPPLVWQVIVLFVVSAILILGVKKGIEKVTKTLMPALLFLILLCVVRALTLPGAMDGVNFLFDVDFAKITPKVMLVAIGLAFFKLSIGMGAMITYGSYFTDDNNMIKTAAKVAFSDTFISILAGLAIFPVVFTFGMEPGRGPGLLFMTIPLVFSQMPFGNILLVIFFILTSIAATTAMLSLVEVPVAFLTEQKGISRAKSVIINALIILAFGILATLSVDKSSVLGNVQFFGKGFFDIFDYLSSYILMPLGGLLIALFVGWFVKKDDFINELSNKNTINNTGYINTVRFLIRYIAPLLLTILSIMMLSGTVKL